MKLVRATLDKDLLRASGLPKRFDKYATFPEAAPMAEQKMVQKYCKLLNARKLDGMGLHIHGAKGSFRTFYAIYVLRHALLTGVSVKYITYDALVAKALSAERGTDFESLVRYGCDMLCIDSLGEASPKGAGYYNVLQRTMQIRADDDLPTILVSTLDAEKFRAVFGAESANLLRRFYITLETKMDQSYSEFEALHKTAQLEKETL
jgi:DNA replication protein DnaC